ncbi:hypothetical protein CWN40_04185 [Klebsiella quasipneumoniae]|uniref:Uncharacterized protein n=1 Tax=Klebsiella quasipneumoniae TaxID=1463165 RepID=A0AAI8IWI4_9ENTR|nr:hypothetical protein DKC00_18455 [Klebsiella quasipneumoniae]OVU93597.1 hypothetical protein BME05_24870 [Klebsiella quasipneumoniae subsp. quasipneumoniae]OVX22010.1 hypothetical protein BME39_03490 [Klebsiella quasipneumoniae subsp. similipneumoniae]OSZ16281.1 hypothetical protein BVZ25_25590 [Klebsiella quasipneumoniae]PLD50620.1 hypothetical protein B6I56_18315 [Klebsiella quasipneumoniae]
MATRLRPSFSIPDFFKEILIILLQNCDVVCIYPPDLYLFLFVIFRTTDALAALDYPSHIVIYVPGDSQTCRLPAARTI